jgi:hypothetical protein
MLTQKLTQLHTAFTSLKEKILAKLSTQQETITQKEQALTESNHNLELHMKANSDNETVLDKLLNDFKELQTALE